MKMLSTFFLISLSKETHKFHFYRHSENVTKTVCLYYMWHICIECVHYDEKDRWFYRLKEHKSVGMVTRLDGLFLDCIIAKKPIFRFFSSVNIKSTEKWTTQFQMKKKLKNKKQSLDETCNVNIARIRINVNIKRNKSLIRTIVPYFFVFFVSWPNL